MTANHDLDRQLTDFLRDGPEELPYGSFDAVRDRTEQTRQRVVVGPWRFPDMNKIVPLGLGAAAVVLALVVGAQLFGSPSGGFGGPGTEPSATPEPTAQPTAEPSAATDGRAVWLDSSVGVPVTITVPDSGWQPTRNFFAIERSGNSAPPDGAAILAFTDHESWYVPGDACQFEASLPDTPATTVDEMVAALANQASRDATDPVAITVGGYAGQSITLRVPDPMPSDCDFDQFCTFVDPGATRPLTADHCARIAQGPGQIDQLWIVDVDGTLVVIDAASYEGTPAADMEEMQAIVDSIAFEAP